jgi:predicted nucleic acid-binding Zn ribbon protein
MLPRGENSNAETDRRKTGVYRHRINLLPGASSVTIGDAIRGAIDKLGLSAKFQEHRALSLWPEIVGEQVAEVAKAYQIQHGELRVSVAQATWRYHLMFERENYRNRLNALLGTDVVRLIRFTK